MAEQSDSDLKANLRFEANKKSVLVAYLFLVFFGWFGVHRFYAGKTNSAIIMLCIFLFSWPLLAAGLVGLLGFIALATWCFVDLFLLHGLITKYNNALVVELTG